VYLVLLIHRDWGGDMNGLNTCDGTQTQQKGTRVLESFRELQREKRVRAAASSIAVILRIDNCYLPPATCHLLPATCHLPTATCRLPPATCYLPLCPSPSHPAHILVRNGRQPPGLKLFPPGSRRLAA